MKLGTLPNIDNVGIQEVNVKRILFGIAMLVTLLVLISGTTLVAQTPAITSIPAILSISLSTSPPATPLASPAPNTTYFDVKVSVTVTGFNLVNKIGQPNAPGEGHIIYYWAEPPTFPGQPAYSGPGTYSTPGTTATSFTWTNATSTYQIYAAQLVNNDDTPLDPPVFAELVSNIPVPGASNSNPMITSMSLNVHPPSSPPASPNPNTGDIDVTVNCQTTGFTPAPTSSPGANSPGMGYLVYYQVIDPITLPDFAATIGTSYSYTSNSNTFKYLNGNSGYASFAVQLVNNDTTPLNSPVYAMIKTNLSPTTGTGMPSATAGQASPTAAPSAGAITINLTAQNLAFSTNTITVPAGSQVTIIFNNNDSGVRHNVAVYTDSNATTLILRGTPITGPGTTRYSFIAPTEPGTYFFRCDFHPGQMFGDFVVTP